jgi:hypothetical protein
VKKNNYIKNNKKKVLVSYIFYIKGGPKCLSYSVLLPELFDIIMLHVKINNKIL